MQVHKAGEQSFWNASGTNMPRTDWLPDKRHMILVEDWHYTSAAGVTYTANAGLIIDGKTTPRLTWSTYLAGSPYTGLSRYGSIIHDQICEDALDLKHDGNLKDAKSMRRAADVLFYEMMRFSGVMPVKAWVMYRAVRAGARACGL